MFSPLFKHLLISLLAALLAGVAAVHAAIPADFAVDLKATPSEVSPVLTLSWTQRLQSNITAQKIHRRLKGETTWVKLADLSTSQTSYADTTAVVGVEYEYWMERSLNIPPYYAMGYLSAGVKVSASDSRGTLLLVVDDTMNVPLAPEIEQLKMDLAADGWTVQQIIAPRSGTAAGTKALVKAAYDADPANVKMLYILGHVPVPYSGFSNPDGHYSRALPSDGYYADMDGNWTDATTFSTSTTGERGDNVAGDGKFDQGSLPSLVELQVGRVDMANLTAAPSSAVSEATLLRRYLHKAHDFRHKLGAYADIPRRTLIRDTWGYAFSSEPFAVTAWSGALTCLGQTYSQVDQAPALQWFSPSYAGGKTYLWGHLNGGGNYEYASDSGSSSDFGHQPSGAVFTSAFGSYFEDWDVPKALMRSIIAGNASGDSLALCCFWQGRPNWFVHSLGMGETLGYMTRQSMNSALTGGGGYKPAGNSSRGVHLGLMGDPALRLHTVTPPRGLVGKTSSGQVTLNWAASTESGLQGYHVYRSDSTTGPFAKLTAVPLTGTSFSDSTVVSGNTYTYLVRTQKLETVPGGSYYNMSVGSPLTITAGNAGTAAPANPSELSIVSQSGAAGTQLTWQDNSSDETGFRVERRTNAGGAFATIATLPANTTTYTDAGPFTHGNVYFYRVVALGAAGDSTASNEVSFEAVAGFVEFLGAKIKVNNTTGTVSIGVKRYGGGVGAVTVTCTTSNYSAVAGTHYTATTSNLSWADGEQGIKYLSVPVGTATPQLPRQFRVGLSGPTGGLALALWSSTAVLIEDTRATLDAPWQHAVLGTLTDYSPAVSAEGVIGDCTMAGALGGTADSGSFAYQSHLGDGVLTARIPSPTTQDQSASRFALMVRSSTARGAIMAGSVTATSTANFGTKMAYRSATNGSATLTPSADNNQDTPQWLRITRSGNTFTSESSIDGTTWTTLGTVTLADMPETALWGLFHCSADWAVTNSYAGNFQLAIFQNVSFSTFPAPVMPTGLSVGTATPTTIPLTWTISPYAAGYRIERRGEDGSVVQLPDIIVSGGSGSYSDTTVQPDSAYEYRIRAYNSVGESGSTAFVRVVTPSADITTTITADDAGGADAGVQYDNASTNYGSDTTLPITASSYWINGANVEQVTKAWLRFNLGSVSTVKSAQLKMAFVGAQNLQPAFDAGNNYTMGVSLLTSSDSSDIWDENTINWTNAPQNNTNGISIMGSTFILSLYQHDSFSTVPAANSVVTFNLTASSINNNRGDNNLITFALHPYSYYGGTVVWASREHATLPPPTLEITSSNPSPARPGFLTVAPGTGSTMDLTWFDGTGNEAGFQIERRVANGDWTLLQSLPANTTSFTDTSALPGVIYEYRIRATSATLGSSAWATVTSLQFSSVAKVNRPVLSTDGVTFDLIENAPGNGFVPTGFTYAPAPVPFATGQTLSSTLRNNAPGWLGTQITVGANPIAIRSLGRWVVAGNSASHVVKLVNAANNQTVPGGSVTIDTAGAPVGFKYVDLAAPVTLAANTAYNLVSQEVSGGDQWYEGNTALTFDSSVASLRTIYSGNGVNWTLYNQNCSYGPVNFKYSTVPVPFVTGHNMTTLRNDYSGWAGMELTVGASPITVAQLGRWVVSGNTGVHAVKLVDATTGTTVASATVDTLGSPAGQFKYATLASPVTLAANTRYYLLSQETAGGDQWYDYASPASGTATGYQVWLLANGLPMDESGLGSATASPANDGLPNLVKYALGLSPDVSGNAGRLAQGVATVSDQEYFSLSYTRPEPSPAGISYTVESSSSLTPGTWSSAGLVEVGSTVEGAFRTVTVRSSSPLGNGGKIFLRLRVNQQ